MSVQLCLENAKLSAQYGLSYFSKTNGSSFQCESEVYVTWKTVCLASAEVQIQIN